MVIMASATRNGVFKDNLKIAPYFRKINGEKYSYDGKDTKRSDTKDIGERRKKLGFKYRIFKVGKYYMLYTSTSRFT